jgi:hypothetical protein
MIIEIVKIALLCIFIGSASIPISFTINASPWIVWIGNAAGSLLSALVVIFIGDRILSDKFRLRISKSRFGKKIVLSFDEGNDNKNVIKARGFINKHGLRIFSLLCPIFPGVLLSTVTVYLLDLDKTTYKRWMFSGVIFVSGAYVMGYWWIFVR